MLTAALGDVLLRQVPQHLLAGVQTGELQVFGSIIRSVASGRITGHLQETAGLAQLAGRALSAPATLPLQGVGMAADLIGHGVTITQNEQIKSAIHALHALQVADLALGAAGVGVSVAGFAIVSAKITRVEKRIAEIFTNLEHVTRKIDMLRLERVAEDFTRLRTAAEQMEEGWLLSDPAPQWRQVANEAHALANAFERRARELIAQGEDLASIDPFLEAFALAAATRVSSRLASGDDLVARRAADEGTRVLVSLGEHVSLGEATLRAMSANGVSPGSVEWGEKLEMTAGELKPAIEACRAREAAAASRVITLAELERQGISGRSWLEIARQEEDSPVLCLLPLAA